MTVKLLLTVIISIAAFGWAVVGAGNVTKPTSRSEDQLSLRWTIDRGDYLLGEPIVAEMVLYNQSYQPVSWSGVFGPGRDVNFEAVDTSGRQTRWEGKSSIGMFKPAASLISPGGEVRSPILIDRYVLSDLLSRPGRYQLRLEFNYRVYEGETNRTSRVVSNTVEIEIREPLGLNREAFDFMNGPLDVASKDTNNPVITQRQQEFVDRFASSVYAKFVVFQLANTYQAMGETGKAAREICKLAGQDFFYQRAVDKKIYELEAKLRPFAYPAGLPENAPLPERPHPCSRMLN